MKFYDLYLSIIRDAVMRLSGGSGGPSVTVQPLAVTANGTYEAEDGTAFSPVNVNVRPDVVQRYIHQNGLYRASEEHRDGFSVVDVDVRGDFLPPAVDYPEIRDQVQSGYIKQLISTPTGSTVTIRTGTAVSVAVGDKVLFDGTDAGTSLIYAAWGTVTSTRSYAAYRSVTLRIDGVSVRPTGEISIVKTGYGKHSVIGDLSVQVNSNLEDIPGYTISENGQTVITPSAGYDGLSSVTVDVNVSGGGGAFQAILPDTSMHGDYAGAAVFDIDTSVATVPTGDDLSLAYSDPAAVTFYIVDDGQKPLPIAGDRVILRGKLNQDLAHSGAYGAWVVDKTIQADCGIWGVVGSIDAATLAFSSVEGFSVVDPIGEFHNTALTPVRSKGSACFIPTAPTTWTDQDDPTMTGTYTDQIYVDGGRLKPEYALYPMSEIVPTYIQNRTSLSTPDVTVNVATGSTLPAIGERWTFSFTNTNGAKTITQTVWGEIIDAKDTGSYATVTVDPMGYTEETYYGSNGTVGWYEWVPDVA